METITEDQHGIEKPRKSNADTNNVTGTADRKSHLGRLLSVFKANQALPKHDSESMSLATISGEPLTVHSNIAAGDQLPAAAEHQSVKSMEVIVRKEVRQGSETAETLPMKAYEGA